MSFGWFRKYEKYILWATVVLSVLIFATFSGLGDLQALIQGQDTAGEAGRFVNAVSGETVRVSINDFLHARNVMNRLMRSQGIAVEEDDVWRHLMLVSDAKAAGLGVSDDDVRMFITGGRTLSKEEYRQIWMAHQFSSARELETLARQMLLVQQWVEFKASAARIVDVDEVYLRWRVDNERFDFQAIVVPDADPEAMADPSASELRAFYDEQTEAYRSSRYRDPARQDLVYAWLPLDADAARVADGLLTDLPEPSEAALVDRFESMRAERWPELEVMDDAARAQLVRELKIAGHVQRALTVFEALEDRSAETFKATMQAAGLTVVDPEGALGREEIQALDRVGNELLPLWLGPKQAGQTHSQQPRGDETTAAAFYVESVVPSRELSYEEAHDKIVADWKERRRDKAARDLRDAIRERTRALPEVAEIIAPIEEAARARAEEAVAADPSLDEAGQAALREEILDASEMAEVRPRLAEYEQRVWNEVTLPEGARRIELTDVPRAYAQAPDDELEAPDSIERYIKSNSILFRLAAGSVSDPLRHMPSKQTAIVLVTARRFPDQAAMLADEEGMARSRSMLSTQREGEARSAFTPDKVKVAHQLQIPVREDAEAGVGD